LITVVLLSSPFLRYIADKEIERKEGLEKILEDLSQTFARLAVINDLPEDLKQREFVVNCALDVCSASMAYLAINVKHDSTVGGTAGT
jgi:hypothetical protein